MKRIKTVVIFLLVAIALSAQDLDFTADRPGVSTGPATVGRNVIQCEHGLQYDVDGCCGKFTFSNTLFRY